MAKYEIKQTRLDAKPFIAFEAVASGQYNVNSKNYQIGKIAIFQAMQFSDGEVCLWVDDGVHYVRDRLYTTNKLKLLKLIQADKNLSFDELYTLAVQYV